MRQGESRRIHRENRLNQIPSILKTASVWGEITGRRLNEAVVFSVAARPSVPFVSSFRTASSLRNVRVIGKPPAVNSQASSPVVLNGKDDLRISHFHNASPPNSLSADNGSLLIETFSFRRGNNKPGLNRDTDITLMPEKTVMSFFSEGTGGSFAENDFSILRPFMQYVRVLSKCLKGKDK